MEWTVCLILSGPISKALLNLQLSFGPAVKGLPVVWAVNVNLYHPDFQPRGLPRTTLGRLHSENPRAEQAFESREYSRYLQWLGRKPLA